jgi:uncharacterized Tic20 family protein
MSALFGSPFAFAVFAAFVALLMAFVSFLKLPLIAWFVTASRMSSGANFLMLN